MASKYYAVKVGRSPGVYSTWNECKKMVDGFPGAVYKSFTNKEEAEKFVAQKEDDKFIIDQNHVEAYVDGSFDKSLAFYSYGCVIKYRNEVYELSGVDNDSVMLCMNNVAGELLGSISAISWAMNKGARSICIYHDYEGIAKWANDEWKANKDGTINYKKFIEMARKKIHIAFEKVPAHSGVEFNERADKLAKNALFSRERNVKKSIEEELFNETMASKLSGSRFVLGNYSINHDLLKEYIIKCYEYKNGSNHAIIQDVGYEFNLNQYKLFYSINLDKSKTYEGEINLQFLR